MLLGNYSVLNKTPGRQLGGSTLSGNRSNWNGNARRNMFAGGVASFNGVPVGYRPPYSFVLPKSSGGLAALTTVRGSSSTTANLAGGLNAAAPLTGAGDITSASMTLLMYAAAALTGSGSLTAFIAALANAGIDLTGSGAVSSAVASGAVSGDAALTGSSDLDASLAGSFSASADLAGNSALVADITGLIQALAALSGSSSVAAPLTATANASGGLSGSGSLTASIAALANLLATVQGAGTVSSASMTAFATISADILSYGLLSPESLSSAVWSALAVNFNTPGTMGEKMGSAASAGDPWGTALPGVYAPGTAGALLGNLSAETAGEVLDAAVENGMSVQDALRIMLAVLAGKSSGGGTATVRFRDLADTKDRVEADVDSNGNRTSVTHDPV